MKTFKGGMSCRLRRLERRMGESNGKLYDLAAWRLVFLRVWILAICYAAIINPANLSRMIVLILRKTKFF